MSDVKKLRNTVGKILKKREGGFYIELQQDLIAPAGTILNVQDPRDTIDYLVNNNKITKEEGEKRRSEIKDFIKYEISKTFERQVKAKPQAENTPQDF